MTKTDIQLKHDIEKELAFDPRINAAQIGVTVDHGAVALLGTVDHYAEKWAAETATQRVSGVRTVALDLKVKLLGPHQRSDAELATAVQQALERDVFVPRTVTAEVQHSQVTLKGQVNWHYQLDAAERAVRYLKVVVGVTNSITMMPEASATQVKELVEAALQRQDPADAKKIHVATSGSKVTLTGHAFSFQAVRDASDAAWGAPGVTQVVDQVQVQLTM